MAERIAESCADTTVFGAASKHLLLAIAQVDIAVLLTDPSGDITYVNPHFTTLTGYTSTTALGRPVGILRSSVHDASFYRELHTCLTDGKMWSGRITIRMYNGTNYPARGIATPLRGSAGTITGYSVFFRDTMDEMKLEAQLRQVQKMEAIGELAAGIAHEINTPIQYVGDNIQFLRGAMYDMFRLIDRYHGVCESARESGLESAGIDELARLREEIDWDFLRDEIPEAIEQALEGRNRVAEIVRAMKEFAHPGDESLTPVDLGHAVKTTLAVSRSEWKHVAEVKVELADDIPAVPCFPGSFNQVLLNLVINAAHAIADSREEGQQDKGMITITTRLCDDAVELRVQDTGCGISPEHRDRIFEPFYTTKDIGKGTGQGLALTHLVIVERMGGEIDVETAPGEGTTFVLKLPLKAAESTGGHGA